MTGLQQLGLVVLGLVAIGLGVIGVWLWSWTYRDWWR